MLTPSQPFSSLLLYAIHFPSPSLPRSLPIILFWFAHFQLSSFPGVLPATGITRPLGGSISNAGGSVSQPSIPNYFGFNAMAPCSSGFSPLNSAFGVPAAHMASPTQNASFSALTMPNMGFPMANPHTATRMVQPSTAGPLIGEFSSMSLAGTVTPQAPVLHRPPLVWGTGTGAVGKGNNIF